MSTKDVSNVREKRGTSPSPSPSPSHLKSSPKPSKTVSTSRSLDSSPSLEKAIPNYLKPTLSSGNATKLQGRRPVSNTDSTLKNLARRRSFDKPPSPTRTLKTRGISPTPTFRSSSFSGKIGAGRAMASPKSDMSLKGTREAGKQHLYARAVGTLKKSATFTSKSKKAETATASLRKKDSSDHEESSIAGDEEDSVVPDQELDSSNEQTEGEIDEDTLEDESHKADSPTASEQPDADDAAEVESSPTILEQRDASIGEAKSPTICEESDDNVPKIESPTLVGQDDADTMNDADAAKAECPLSSEQHVESPPVSEQAEGNSSQQQEVEDHNANEMDTTTNPDQSVAGDPNEDKDRDKGEEAKALDTKLEVEAGELQQGVVEEDGEAAPRLSHGKKDVALSNNVIEEMTREQRRNKVRALAGAFETVISLQEHK